MPLPRRWLILLLACAGCQSLAPVASPPLPTASPTPMPAPTVQPHLTAGKLWEDGQKAMREGQPDKAIILYKQSLTANPEMDCNHLSLAAAHLEKGDQVGACEHLANYVKIHPENWRMRVHHAELLWRLKKCNEARAAFESTVADTQDDLPTTHLIHCHSRLMQIAEAEDNEYAARLNRGIGLYLLARERAELKEMEGEPSVEGLLCRALAELTMARLDHFDEARPCWYLHVVWSKLAQRQPAQRWLREANASAPFSYLTPAEQRSLQLASRE